MGLSKREESRATSRFLAWVFSYIQAVFTDTRNIATEVLLAGT